VADPSSTRSGADRLAAVDADRLQVLVIAPGQQPEDREPYSVYLGQLTGETLRTMRGCLDRIARILAGVRLDEPTPEDVERGAPVKATREPAGRDVAETELDALLAACDDSPLGVGDAAMIAVVYVTGIRRSEAAALTLSSYSSAAHSLRLVGKGNKERTVPISATALPWLDAWLRVRGGKPGPLFCPLRKGGNVEHRHLTSQTIADLLERRRIQAGVALPVKPHDLRRTLIGDLLDNGTDLVTAQQIAGHAGPRTTSKYDRRGLDTKRDAVDGLRLPSRQPPPS
jgi:integrase